MGLAVQSSGLNKRSFLAIFLCFALIFSLLSTVLVKPAEAKTSRLAVISSLSGDVTVKKGGGSKSYDAYAGMSLNQGDTLFTDPDASVTLNVSNGDSEITLGGNSEFNISDLAGGGTGKKSKLKMWAGSMWVKVKSLAGANDQFEVETPTAVMGVRGTQFFVGVDPDSGKSKLAVGAGVVSATIAAPPRQGGNTAGASGIAPAPPEGQVVEALIYMTQQLTVDSRNESQDLSVNIEPLDIAAIVKDASPNVIQAIVENKAAIDKENAEFIDRAKTDIANGNIFQNANSTFVVNSLEELNKVIVNLNNLVGNIAKNAVDTNKIDKATMDKTVENANKNIVDPSQKLDLANVQPFDPTAGVNAEAEKQRKADQEKLDTAKQQKQLGDQKKQVELKAALEATLKALANARTALEEANKKAKAEEKVKAEAVLLSQLDEAAKAKFQESKVVVDTAKTPTPSTQTTPPPSTDNSSPTITPKVSITKSGPVDEIYSVTVGLKDFIESNQLIYGAELHLLFNSGISDIKADPESQIIFNSSTSVFSSDIHAGTDPNGGGSLYELIHVIMNYGDVSGISVSNEKSLVKFNFKAAPGATLKLAPSGLTIVNKQGTHIVPSGLPTNPIIFSLPPA